MVAGNWKMNGSLEKNQELLRCIKPSVMMADVQIVVCPPAIYIPQAAQMLADSNIAWGAQNLSHLANGAYTGEISASMLRDLGCGYVIVGHSERRALNGESDALVAEKYAAAINAGLIPILCVGELLAERQADATQSVVSRQLDAVIARVGIDGIGKGVIAYEPVWAIGTGVTASPDQAQEVHRYIRERLASQDESIANRLQILYGGSVKPDNAAQLFAMPDIDGGLIGGASLEAGSFVAICHAA